MIDRHDLTSFYRQNLERDIIEYISKVKNLSLEQSMNVYYRSKLSQQIGEGRYGIDNLDSKYLAEDLIKNEAELFHDVVS